MLLPFLLTLLEGFVVIINVLSIELLKITLGVFVKMRNVESLPMFIGVSLAGY